MSGSFLFVNDRAQLEDCRFADDVVAVDLEWFNRDNFFEVPSLLQLATSKNTYLIDLTVDLDLTEVSNVLTNSDTEKVVHSARGDFVILSRLFDSIDFQNFLDTQIAWGFLHSKEGISYQELVRETLAIELGKSSQNSDWLQRPLSKTQMQYAASDVSYLIEIWPHIKNELKHVNRWAWFIEEMTSFIRKWNQELEQPYLRVGNVDRLNQRNLQIFSRLYECRDNLCREFDIAPERLVSAKTLLLIARERYHGDFRHAVNANVNSHLTYVVNQFHVAKNQGSEENITVPRLLDYRIDRVRKLHNKLRGSADEAASRANIASQRIYVKKDIHGLVKSVVKTGDFPYWFGEWRRELVGDEFHQHLKHFIHRNSRSKAR